MAVGLVVSHVHRVWCIRLNPNLGVWASCRQRPCTVNHIHSFSHTSSHLDVGLVSYDGEDSQSDSDTPNVVVPTSSKVDNVRVIISRLAVAVSLWLAIPLLASGLRTKVRR